MDILKSTLVTLEFIEFIIINWFFRFLTKIIFVKILKFTTKKEYIKNKIKCLFYYDNHEKCVYQQTSISTPSVKQISTNKQQKQGR